MARFFGSLEDLAHDTSASGVSGRPAWLSAPINGATDLEGGRTEANARYGRKWQHRNTSSTVPAYFRVSDLAPSNQFDVLGQYGSQSSSTRRNGVIYVFGDEASATAYHIQFEEQFGAIRLVRFNGNSNSTELVVASGLSLGSSDIYFFRVNAFINGSGNPVIQVKFWLQSGAYTEAQLANEPGTWTIDYEDTSGSKITTPGRCGVAAGGPNGAGNSILCLNWAGFATDGDTAPTEPVSTGGASQIIVEAALASAGQKTALGTTALVTEATLTTAGHKRALGSTDAQAEVLLTSAGEAPGGGVSQLITEIALTSAGSKRAFASTALIGEVLLASGGEAFIPPPPPPRVPRSVPASNIAQPLRSRIGRLG